MIFLASPGKMRFLFPENMILFFRRKMKDDLSQKSTWKYDIFLKCSKRVAFSKNIRVVGKMFWCRSRANLSEDACQKSSESIQNWGSYGQKETGYFRRTFLQVPPLK